MLLSLGLYWTAWDRLYAGLKLGRAPRTKETLPDFLKWRRVTRPPLVFRGLTGSQRTPGFWGVTIYIHTSEGCPQTNKTIILIRGLGECERVGEDSGSELVM